MICDATHPSKDYDPTNGLTMKYTPKRQIMAPAPLRNQVPIPCQALFPITFRTAAVELPATMIGRQWPIAKNRMKRIPVAIFCCTVIMAKIGAMNPKVQDPDNMPYTSFLCFDSLI